MITEEMVFEAFKSYEVRSDVKAVFGNWAVSTDGDIINVEFQYPIFSYQLSDGYDDWNEHLQEKNWYDYDTEKNFKLAFNCAISCIR